MKVKKPCIEVIGLARCTGCFGCQSACSRKAIEILLDADGFYKPTVNREKCNECGVCQMFCPVIVEQEGGFATGNWPEPKAFAAWTTDETLRLASSSGGLFSELARPVIAAGGAVAGCVWGEYWTPEHVLAHTWSEVERMRGSKYVPSNVGDIYKQVIAFLRDSKNPVLFSGTPCQVAAMAAALNPKQRERVLLVEVICHGVPSLRVFHRYLEELFDGDAVVDYTFRDKSLGWYTVKAVAVEGKCHRVPAPDDDFFQGFAGHHLYVMESCHQCPVARLPRVRDITLGDFWGCPELWHDRLGVSVVLANNQAGLTALNSLDISRITIKPTDVTIATAKNQQAVAGGYPIPSNRRAFLDGLANGLRFSDLKAKYFPTRGQLWLSSFRKSTSKLHFLTAFIYRRFCLIFHYESRHQI